MVELTFVKNKHECASKQKNDETPGKTVAPTKNTMVTLILLEVLDGKDDACHHDAKHWKKAL